MAYILALETSTELASVALLRGQELSTRESAGVQTHSETVLVMLQELLLEAGITLAQCDALAFGAGPGSFTGVRTACGLAQGLAFGANVPVVPVVSLLAMAEAARAAGGGDDILAVLDARMGEVYWAQYRFEDEWVTVVPPMLSKPAEVKPQGLVEVCGNGLAAYFEEFAQLGHAIRHPEQMPHAAHVARLAATAVDKGQILHARDAQPIYLRNKVALTTKERLAGART
jgi:tRNA threonylcarbamoyladenosine biosynthesis protein TsaB